MHTPALRPASDCSLDQLAGAFTAAYAGYFLPVHMTAGALDTHITTNEIALDRSIVAQAPNGTLEGIALLGVRGERGWVGGVGVVPAWRGKGWGAALMQAVIAQARERGLHTMQLEVLQQNTVARHLYERLGFAVTRPLDIFTGQLARLPTHGTLDGAISPIALADALATYPQLHLVALPWQREPATLAHLAERSTAIQALALIRDAHIQATLLYAAARDASLTLFDLGSRGATPDERRDHGLALLDRVLANQPSATVRAVNIPPGDPLGEILRSLGCPVVMAQFEMRLDLG